MVKVTIDNVTKLSEDALYMVLEATLETDPIYALIDSELNRRLQVEADSLKVRQNAQVRKLLEFQACQIQIQEIFSGYTGKKTMFLIDRLGGEFFDNYTIDEETFTVYSAVAENFRPDNNSSWEFDSLEKANRKKIKLVYDRIYDKFMRHATKENVEFLKKALS